MKPSIRYSSGGANALVSRPQAQAKNNAVKRSHADGVCFCYDLLSSFRRASALCFRGFNEGAVCQSKGMDGYGAVHHVGHRVDSQSIGFLDETKSLLLGIEVNEDTVAATYLI